MNDGNICSKNTFCDILRKRRKKCGYKSCSKLAMALLPPQSTFSELYYYNKSVETMRKKIERWESGVAEPTVSEFKQICDALECDPEYLWGVCPTPRKETKEVMDVTGLSEEAVDYVSGINEFVTRDRLGELDRLLRSQGMNRLLLLMLRVATYKEFLEDDINDSLKYAHEVLERIPISNNPASYWTASPDNVTASYTEVKRWRAELNEHFGHMVDEMYDVRKMTDCVTEIERIYSIPRVHREQET